MKIETITDEEYKKVDNEIVCSSLFQNERWFDYVLEGNEIKLEFLKVIEGSTLYALMPLCIDCKKNIVMPKLTQNLGVMYRKNIKKNKKKEVLIKVVDEISKRKGTYHLSTQDFYPEVINKNKNILSKVLVNQYLNTQSHDYEVIRKKFSCNISRDIKYAEKRYHLTISELVECHELYKLVEKSYASKGRDVPYKLCELLRIKKKFTNDALLRGVIYGDKLIAAGMFIHSNGRIVYLIGGMDRRFSNINPVSHLLNQIIAYACNAKIQFSFEGSNEIGINNYYERFGAEVEYYYQISSVGFKDVLAKAGSLIKSCKISSGG